MSEIKIGDCLTEPIKTLGDSLQLSSTGLDIFTEVYKANQQTYVLKIGDKEIKPGVKHPNHSGMGCKSVSVQSEKGFHTITIVWHGFWDGAIKMPTGGLNSGTTEQPIRTHPNYTISKRTWHTELKENGQGFGDGSSPNAFGRVENNGNVYFGPLPGEDDGNNNTPDPSKLAGATMLQGIEGFLTADQPTYRYSRLTDYKWGPRDDLGKTMTPNSDLIPLPSDADRNWLLLSVDEDAEVIFSDGGSSLTAWNTTVEFQLSMNGKWNPLIYEGGSDLNLDTKSTVKPVSGG